jgi:hypothetical protein
MERAWEAGTRDSVVECPLAESVEGRPTLPTVDCAFMARDRAPGSRQLGRHGHRALGNLGGTGTGLEATWAAQAPGSRQLGRHRHRAGVGLRIDRGLAWRGTP